VTVNFGAGKAEMTATDLPVVDYFTIPNALFHFATPVAATCSFDISWNVPVTDRSPVNAPSGSPGELVMCHATMRWSASNASGFHFATDPMRQRQVWFAQLRKVRNGAFDH
jgi:hypothetical protein